MRIGELSRRTGVSRRSLRYYEEQGLLGPARLPNGYREYDEHSVTVVRRIQILLSGKLRPFVCVRDLALELLRRGLEETVRTIDVKHGSPVVLEFAGPSARLISVPERALLCSLAPRVGAVSAVFVGD